MLRFRYYVYRFNRPDAVSETDYRTMRRFPHDFRRALRAQVWREAGVAAGSAIGDAFAAVVAVRAFSWCADSRWFTPRSDVPRDGGAASDWVLLALAAFALLAVPSAFSFIPYVITRAMFWSKVMRLAAQVPTFEAFSEALVWSNLVPHQSQPATPKPVTVTSADSPSSARPRIASGRRPGPPGPSTGRTPSGPSRESNYLIEAERLEMEEFKRALARRQSQDHGVPPEP